MAPERATVAALPACLPACLQISNLTRWQSTAHARLSDTHSVPRTHVSVALSADACAHGHGPTSPATLLRLRLRHRCCLHQLRQVLPLAVKLDRHLRMGDGRAGGQGRGLGTLQGREGTGNTGEGLGLGLRQGHPTWVGECRREQDIPRGEWGRTRASHLHDRGAWQLATARAIALGWDGGSGGHPSQPLGGCRPASACGERRRDEPRGWQAGTGPLMAGWVRHGSAAITSLDQAWTRARAGPSGLKAKECARAG